MFTSEIYATSTRNTGVACCSMFARLGGMAAPLVAKLGAADPLLPVAVFGAFAWAAALLGTFMPETKGARLPQSVEESEDFGAGQSLWQEMGRTKRRRRRSLGAKEAPAAAGENNNGDSKVFIVTT